MSGRNGYTKMLVADFDDFNADALTRMQVYRPDPTMTQYTTSAPDTDQLYCWARVEEDFTSKVMSPEELALVKTKEEAVTAGMQISDE